MYEENSLYDLVARVSEQYGQDHELVKIVNTESVRVLKKELKKLIANEFNPKYTSLSSIGILATKLFLKYDDLPRIQFQSRARAYFTDELGAISVSFKDKIAGIHLGNLIVVQFKDGQEILYYGKTHCGGQKSQDESSSIKPVDLKELLIYKVLELLGLGVEAHFFYDDINNFYIATKDAGYDDANKKPGEFMTYQEIREKKSSEDLLKKDFIVDGFIKADIFSRLLLLSDVINNGTNTGLSSSNQFKIIDFNPPVTKEYSNPRIFGDWLSANNQYDYTDETVIKILKKDRKDKIKAAINAFEAFDNFESYLKDSHNFVLEQLKSLSISVKQQDDLEIYTKAAVQNYKTFSSHFNSSKLLDIYT